MHEKQLQTRLGNKPMCDVCVIRPVNHRGLSLRVFIGAAAATTLLASSAIAGSSAELGADVSTVPWELCKFHKLELDALDLHDYHQNGKRLKSIGVLVSGLVKVRWGQMSTTFISGTIHANGAKLTYSAVPTRVVNVTPAWTILAFEDFAILPRAEAQAVLAEKQKGTVFGCWTYSDTVAELTR